MKNVLVIGGTGILGRPLVEYLVKSEKYKVFSVALDTVENDSTYETVSQYRIDRYTEGYEQITNQIVSQLNGGLDAVIDLIAYDRISSEQTLSLFGNHTKHIITISTTLVYNREQENNDPIDETTPLAPEGQYGGYVDGKLRLERFWQEALGVNWTILRPYHVLGKWSLLGCTPEHNRDPQLIQKIQGQKMLSLVNGGEIALNYVHPEDVAQVIEGLIGNSETFSKAYNVVNPTVITALEYYDKIGMKLGKNLRVKSVPLSRIWEEEKGWEMTTLPHVYSTDSLKADVGFVPRITLLQGIEDAIAHQPTFDIPKEEISVHKNMNKLPRPKKPRWLQ